MGQGIGTTVVGLSSTFALTGNALHEPRRERIRRAKGGVIGTNGKPVISFRIDHGIDEWLGNANFWIAFKSRGIPASVGVVTDCVENAADPYEPTTTTWAQLLAAHKDGFEVWAHSRTHRDPAIAGTTVAEEIEGSKAELEAQGFKVFGFQMPGITPCTTPHYSNNFTHPTSWSSEVGQRYLSTYGLVEVGDDGGAVRALPTHGIYGLGHYTLDAFNYAQIKAIIDRDVLGYGLSVQFMVHPRFVVAGSVTWTTSDMISLLDYVKTLWDAGTVEVLTASGLAFADPGTSRRLNLVWDGTFATQTTIPQTGYPWLKGGGAGSPTIVADGGGNYVSLLAADSYTYVYQGCTQLANLHAQGGTFIAEGYARAVGSNTEARITVLDGNDAGRLSKEVYANLTAGGAWTRFAVPFTIPLATTNLQVRVNRRSGSGDIHWKNISIRPV